jgi:hypothetical protein
MANAIVEAAKRANNLTRNNRNEKKTDFYRPGSGLWETCLHPLVQLSRNSGRRGVICNGHCHQFKSNKKPEKSERLMVPLKKPALQAALKKRLFKAYFNFTCPDPTFYSNRNSFFYFERVGK